MEGAFYSLPDHRYQALRDGTSGVFLLSGPLPYFWEVPEAALPEFWFYATEGRSWRTMPSKAVLCLGTSGRNCRRRASDSRPQRATTSP